MAERKNNHFVPKSYLARFQSRSEREIGLYNLRSGQVVSNAPIKTQCSRNYFYTKDPKYEAHFGNVEGEQRQLLSSIVETRTVPPLGSDSRKRLSFGLVLQDARTASAAEQGDYMLNELGKAMLKHSFVQKGDEEALRYIPDLTISQEHSVMEALAVAAPLYPLIDDLECTLFINETYEDFLTSDHPVAQCSGMPGADSSKRRAGYASRGLIILYPLSPRALLFLSDAEAYQVTRSVAGIARITAAQDVVALNLQQCREALSNLYFSNADRVRQTISTFEGLREVLRPEPSRAIESPIMHAGKPAVRVDLPKKIPRLRLPSVVSLSSAVKTGRYDTGDALVRDPLRVLEVKREADRIGKLREEATVRAKGYQGVLKTSVGR